MRILIRKSRSLAKGFSLAEVILAVGITAIGITSLVGLVPTGLDSLRQSAERVAKTKIIQAVVADYQMGDWGQRAAGQMLQDREYTFDEQGMPVPKNDTWRHYTVKAKVEHTTGTGDSTNGVQILGDTTNNRYLHRLTIRITDEKDADAAFADASGTRYSTHFSMVALIEQTGSTHTIKY